MLTLFKGELRLDDILYGLPKKRLLELRDARRDRLLQEQKDLDKMSKERESSMARDKILAK